MLRPIRILREADFGVPLKGEDWRRSRAYSSRVSDRLEARWARLTVRSQRFKTYPGDVLLALVLGVLVQFDIHGDPQWRGPIWVNSLCMLFAALALVWRRAYPTVTCAVVVGAVAIPAALYGASDSPVALFMILVVAYTSAARSRSPLLASLILASGIALHDVRDPQIKSIGDWTYDSTILGLTFLVGLTSRWRQRRLEKAEHAIGERALELEALAAEASAEERRRMARELHDIVSHSLGIVVLQAGAAEAVLDTDPAQARQAMELIRRTGLEAINEMSRLLGLLRGEPEASRSPQPCLSDVAGLVERTRVAGLDVRLDIEGTPVELPAAIELSAYRVVQEGLTNVLKHAAGSPTRVVLRYTEDELEVSVRNESHGQSAGAAPSGGRGLPGLRERVAVFGGRFDAGPVDGGCWRLQAALPVT